MGTIGQGNENTGSNENNDISEYENELDNDEFDGDEVDDDLVFSTVPHRAPISTAAKLHLDEIDDDEMRRFAESFEQEQDVRINENHEIDDDQLCQDYALKMQTPTKSVQFENNKRKGPCIEDLDALLNDDEIDGNTVEYHMEQQQPTSPVFKKKPLL